MALTPEKRKRLRAILDGVSTPEEISKLNDRDLMARTAGNVTSISEALSLVLEDQDMGRGALGELAGRQKKTSRAIADLDAKMMEGFMVLAKSIVDKLDEVKQAGYVGSKGQENFALGIQNMAASLAEGFGSVKKSIDSKPVPVWRWPQYLYSGMRDKTFSPINPSTDGIGVGDFDSVYRTNIEYEGGFAEAYSFFENGPSENAGVPADQRFKISVIVVYEDEEKTIFLQAYKSQENFMPS